MESGYHTTKPYYVLIKTVAKDFIVTTIPEEHTLEIKVGENWDYHIARMTIVGPIEKYRHLLYNQELC